MSRSISLLWVFLALTPAYFGAQGTITVIDSPNGVCPVPTVVEEVVVQAAYFSSYFQSASQVVNIFDDGNTLVIDYAPTTYIKNTYITTVYTSIATNPTGSQSSTVEASNVVATAPQSTSPVSSSTPLIPTSQFSTESAATSLPLTTALQSSFTCQNEFTSLWRDR
jgi:Flp pilus assembly protein TadG